MCVQNATSFKVTKLVLGHRHIQVNMLENIAQIKSITHSLYRNAYIAKPYIRVFYLACFNLYINFLNSVYLNYKKYILFSSITIKLKIKFFIWNKNTTINFLYTMVIYKINFLHNKYKETSTNSLQS